MSKKKSKYHQRIEIPVRIIETKDCFSDDNDFYYEEHDDSNRFFKSFLCLVLSFSLFFSQFPLASAYERHVINVTAHICNYSETRSMGFWKNHSSLYQHYLPQTIGGEEISTIFEAEAIFNNTNANEMKTKLRAQLLATKFNISHFFIGGYSVEGYGVLDDFIKEADLLLQDPSAPREKLEDFKDILDEINNKHQLEYCRTPSLVEIKNPNGRELWLTGRNYDLIWDSSQINCSDGKFADLWYSSDSGKTYAKISYGLEDDGNYSWNVPVELNGYPVPSDRARFKVVIKNSTDFKVLGWDVSDDDFSVSIDQNLLNQQERQFLIDFGFIESPQSTSTEENQGENNKNENNGKGNNSPIIGSGSEKQEEE